MMFLIAILMGAAAVKAGMIQMEKAKIEQCFHLSKGNRVAGTVVHEVIFAIKQRNLDSIEKILMEVSSPRSERYGDHFTRKEVGELTANREATEAIKNYLLTNGAEIVKSTQYGAYITARGTVALWERLFNTEFFEFHHLDRPKSAPTVRSLDYSIDESLASHVQAVFQTSQLPPHMHSRVPARLLSPASSFYKLPGTIDPKILNSFYNVTTNTGNALASQSVFEAVGQYYSEADLKLFESTFSVPTQSIATDVGGYESDTVCASNANNCAEGNLDVQYMIALSQGTPTTYWYEDSTDPFLTWITTQSDLDQPALVQSVSYGSTESTVALSSANQFNTEAMKLGVMGVSIFVSSGDDGAPGSVARDHPNKCGYSPSFPATSPYVTAVGATQGPESGDLTECTCSSQTGAAITSGGGFSSIFSQPSYQKDAVLTFFQETRGSFEPAAGYSRTGRGYPDISLAGYNYQVVIGQKVYGVSGTSASSPAVAAQVSLVNAARLKKGGSPVGFLNPALYTLYDQFTNDVQYGTNLCTASVVCCDEGFTSMVGWDPTNGWGSLNFGLFYETMLAL